MDEPIYRSTTAPMWDALAATYDSERQRDAVYEACWRGSVTAT
jgi:hypothetical protein